MRRARDLRHGWPAAGYQDGTALELPLNSHGPARLFNQLADSSREPSRRVHGTVVREPRMHRPHELGDRLARAGLSYRRLEPRLVARDPRHLLAAPRRRDIEQLPVQRLARNHDRIDRLPLAAMRRHRVAVVDMPAGYAETVANGVVRITNPSLAEYYGRLRLVTSGPLISRARFGAILDLNLGRLDYLIDDYKKWALP